MLVPLHAAASVPHAAGTSMAARLRLARGCGRCVEAVMGRVARGSAELMVASHNQASVEAALDGMRRLGLRPHSPRALSLLKPAPITHHSPTPCLSSAEAAAACSGHSRAEGQASKPQPIRKEALLSSCVSASLSA